MYTSTLSLVLGTDVKIAPRFILAIRLIDELNTVGMCIVSA